MHGQTFITGGLWEVTRDYMSLQIKIELAHSSSYSSMKIDEMFIHLYKTLTIFSFFFFVHFL